MTQGEGGMTTTTTIWRPGVRVSLDENGEVEDTEGEEEEIMKKGTKRKRAPHTKGPCEHGVKYRSKCKVCSACPHGRQRSRCKECGGGSICEHGRQRSRCKECGGGSFCEHGRRRSRCKECGGSQICEPGTGAHALARFAPEPHSAANRNRAPGTTPEAPFSGLWAGSGLLPSRQSNG